MKGARVTNEGALDETISKSVSRSNIEKKTGGG